MKNSCVIIGLLVLVACNERQTSKEVATDSTDLRITNTSAEEMAPIDIDPAELVSASLPATIRFKGKLHKAFKWHDKLGENILITSVVAPYPDRTKDTDDEDGYTSELHAFHFVKADSNYRLLWKISDAVKQCVFDITALFVKEGIVVTDLDKDGIAETTVQYIASCRSDVSPDNMKLIMHEDTTRFALRGLTCDPGTPGGQPCVTEENVNLEKQPAAREEWEEYSRQFGRYENEKDFKNSPVEFLQFARSQWLKHLYPPIQSQ